ncbi:hypothetical protein FJTKL_03177 [Diaporthe vaccinii]|uniref:Uncharacterized protein n=1 Tax=Diaporthe vaccinii TaxID=105482 RepID=A0ABR4DVV7_9PEZI
MYIEGIEWGLPAVDSQRKTGQLQAIESARDETRRWPRSPGELASFIEQTTFFCPSSIYDENPMLRSHSLM